MKRVVLCWEMGGGMGHLVPLSAVARVMLKRGWDVTVIASDLSHAWRYLAPLPIRWFQAPRIPPKSTAKVLANHADMMSITTCSSSQVLRGLLRAWQDLFRLIGADLVICEFAPTAVLAARCASLPCKCIDNGFSVPPVSDPLPAVRDDLLVSVEQLRASEQQVLAVMNEALQTFGAPELPRFSALFEMETWYRNWVALNHFGPHSPEKHLGQIVVDEGGVAPTWPSGHGPKLFAYLKGDHPRTVQLLQSAVDHGYRVLAYAPGMIDPIRNDLVATGRIILSDAPVQLSSLDDDIEIAAWHSPSGGVGHSLDKGMRMLFIPTQQEQQLAGRAVARAGLPAYVLGPPEDWETVFRRLSALPRAEPSDRWRPADLEGVVDHLGCW